MVHRLHSDIETYERNIEEKRSQRLHDELKGCTFAPKTTRYGKSLGPGMDDSLASTDSDLPVWERLQQNRQGIQMLRDEIKKQKDLEGCTFQPETGRKPAQSEAELEPVHERLSKKAKNYEMLSKIKEQQELESCTFMPKTNTSKRAPSPYRREVSTSCQCKRRFIKISLGPRIACLGPVE